MSAIDFAQYTPYPKRAWCGASAVPKSRKNGSETGKSIITPTTIKNTSSGLESLNPQTPPQEKPETLNPIQYISNTGSFIKDRLSPVASVNLSILTAKPFGSSWNERRLSLPHSPLSPTAGFERLGPKKLGWLPVSPGGRRPEMDATMGDLTSAGNVSPGLEGPKLGSQTFSNPPAFSRASSVSSDGICWKCRRCGHSNFEQTSTSPGEFSPRVTPRYVPYGNLSSLRPTESYTTMSFERGLRIYRDPAEIKGPTTLSSSSIFRGGIDGGIELDDKLRLGSERRHSGGIAGPNSGLYSGPDVGNIPGMELDNKSHVEPKDSGSRTPDRGKKENSGPTSTDCRITKLDNQPHPGLNDTSSGLVELINFLHLESIDRNIDEIIKLDNKLHSESINRNIDEIIELDNKLHSRLNDSSGQSPSPGDRARLGSNDSNISAVVELNKDLHSGPSSSDIHGSSELTQLYHGPSGGNNSSEMADLRAKSTGFGLEIKELNSNDSGLGGIVGVLLNPKTREQGVAEDSVETLSTSFAGSGDSSQPAPVTLSHNARADTDIEPVQSQHGIHYTPSLPPSVEKQSKIKQPPSSHNQSKEQTPIEKKRPIKQVPVKQTPIKQAPIRQTPVRQTPIKQDLPADRQRPTKRQPLTKQETSIQTKPAKEKPPIIQPSTKQPPSVKRTLKQQPLLNQSSIKKPPASKQQSSMIQQSSNNQQPPTKQKPSKKQSSTKKLPSAKQLSIKQQPTKKHLSIIKLLINQDSTIKQQPPIKRKSFIKKPPSIEHKHLTKEQSDTEKEYPEKRQSLYFYTDHPDSTNNNPKAKMAIQNPKYRIWHQKVPRGRGGAYC